MIDHSHIIYHLFYVFVIYSFIHLYTKPERQLNLRLVLLVSVSTRESAKTLPNFGDDSAAKQKRWLVSMVAELRMFAPPPTSFVFD